jgi:hypothetical protein
VTPEAVFGLASEHLDDEAAIIATAIAWAESGLRPDAIGDENLQDSVWGPSIGLWQVRSLRAHTGTGKERDANRLRDPAFNAYAMAVISAGGTNWTPWSVFKNGKYLDHIDAVRAAVGCQGGTTMQEWMPGVQNIDRGGGTPVQNNGPTVVVLHTTETDNRASYSGTEPHFEIDDDGSILQYISIAKTAKALYNLGGGVETNRRRGRIIQFELVNRAGRIESITDAQLDGLAEAMRFVDGELPFQKIAPSQGFHGADEGIVLATDDSPIRFSFPDWEDFGGICGHQHVPENDHWDPGRFPLDRLLSRLDASPSTPQGDLAMLTFRYIFDGQDWVFDGPSKLFFQLNDTRQITEVLDPLGVKALGQVSDATHRRYSEVAGTAGFSG